eukprot:TRINITY_DN17124_c0_g1_i3.p1 TRINITY_DN17124_c0_g1~~TRINITY_DN17124_c0_g1_i3.p1  ORF type:complete len:123 (+),score=27.06 TRINITY_DN17124_c0_g1_i3:93-461(+)
MPRAMLGLAQSQPASSDDSSDSSSDSDSSSEDGGSSPARMRPTQEHRSAMNGVFAELSSAAPAAPRPDRRLRRAGDKVAHWEYLKKPAVQVWVDQVAAGGTSKHTRYLEQRRLLRSPTPRYS